MKKELTCCFTGHRPHKLPILGERRSAGYTAFECDIGLAILAKALSCGCDTFLCGMARGADLLCAELVLELRHMFRMNLRLICVVPYLAQAKEWELWDQNRYKTILTQADEKILISRAYTPSCLDTRNRFMVEHSAHMIAIYDGHSQGGTRLTLEYARKSGLCISVLCPPGE